MSGIPLNIDWQQILLHLFNFTILFAGLYFLLYKPVKNFMEKREKYYRDMQDNADDLLSRAQESKAEYEPKLAEAEKEIAGKKKAAAEEIEQMRRTREKEAEDAAEKILSDARDEARAARAMIVDGARKEITEMVNDAAEKILLSEDVSTTYDAFLDAAERSVPNGES